MTTDKEFIELVYEVAFGDNAINKGFTKGEVLAKIREYSDKALEYEDENWTTQDPAERYDLD